MKAPKKKVQIFLIHVINSKFKKKIKEEDFNPSAELTFENKNRKFV